MDAVADLINPYYPAEMIGRLERGDLSFHEACDAMRKLDGRYDVTDAQIAGAYGAFLAGVPVWKLRQVERLRGAGIRTYVLSNNNPASMEVIRGEFTADGHTMDDYFDKVYLSYELRELKPSEAIFRKVIADSERIIAGMLTVMFRRRMQDFGMDTKGVEPWAYMIVGGVQLATHSWMSNPHMTSAELIDYLTMLCWSALCGIVEVGGSLERFNAAPHPSPVPPRLR